MPEVTSYPFKFSFVMPLYNVEKYLDETVQSILSQTLDFEENCEIIFVNDGSPDDVEAICLRYKERFPDNIKYHTQKNSGVSIARNKGIELAEGEYVSFLDSDDLLSKDALEGVYTFFEEHPGEVDVVSIKMQFFEANKNPHVLNYKFHTSRVVDIEKEYDNVQLSASSAFIRLAAIRGRYTFDSRLTVTEDAVLVSQVILNKMKYGVLSQPTYYYRRRVAGGSAINTSTKDKRWYTNTPKFAYAYLIEYSMELLGHLPRYIMFLVMYDIQWRFQQETQDILDDKELAAYKRALVGLLQDIDDDIILEQRHLSVSQKLFILVKKHGETSEALIRKVYKQYEPPVWIEFITIHDNTLTLEGHINFLLDSKSSLYFDLNGRQVDIERVPRPDRRQTFLGEEVYDGGGYNVSIPMSAEGELRAYLKRDGKKITQVPLYTRRFSRLANTPYAYSVQGDWLFEMLPSTLRFRPYSTLRHGLFEVRWLIRVILGVKLRYSLELLQANKAAPGGVAFIDKVRPFLIPFKAVLQNLATVLYRVTYRILILAKKRPVWIVSDRTTAAGDNGEALFRYLSTVPDLPAKVVFAIARRSPDYVALKRYGRVVPWGSIRYKLLFLTADKVLSSHFDDFVINPFGARLSDFVDIMNFDFVFLQHGIIKDDLSGLLNRYNKNIALFVTSAKPEYDSVRYGTYGYTHNEVRLTGLPRYDLLVNTPKNKVIIAPTWRKILADEANQRTGTRSYDNEFKKSEYFTFYQSLLTDERVLGKLEQLDMVMEFYLHPSHATQVRDYRGGKRVAVMAMPYNYTKAFAEGSVLVTDYSSVAFDFAYLKKPVMYAQFDKADFFDGHVYDEGYFSYEDNGFGPVAYTYEDAIKQLLKLMEGGPQVSAKYQQRIESFFYKFDHHNSKRVYEAILDLDKK